jgi:hypothetical protein
MDDTIVEETLQALRDGASLQVGGSRAHATYHFDATSRQWCCEVFDEGATRMEPVTESYVRSVIRDNPASAAAVLRARHPV